MHEKHQDLIQSYSKQINEVTRLNARIAELAAELNAVQHCQDSAFSEMIMSEKFNKFDKFDAFSSTAMLNYEPHGTLYDRQPIEMDAEFALNSFEDSL